MNKLVTPLRRVELNDPVNVRDVDAASCQIRRQQHCTTRRVVFPAQRKLPKLVVNLGALLLIDFSVEFAHDVALASLREQVLQRLLVEVHGGASPEEDDETFGLKRVNEA